MILTYFFLVDTKRKRWQSEMVYLIGVMLDLLRSLDDLWTWFTPEDDICYIVTEKGAA